MKLMKRVGSLPQDKPNSIDLPRKPGAFGARDTGQNPSSKCLLHQNANHFTRKCRAFCSKSAEERAAIVKRTSDCHFCLRTEHVGKPCRWKEKWGPCKFTDCEKFHSHLLHDVEHKGLLMFVNPTKPAIVSSSATSSVTSSENMNLSDSVLLLIQDIPTESDHVLSFFDTGSTMSLVSRSFTRRNHMRGVKTSFELVTIGGKVSSQHTYYHNIADGF